MACCNQQTIMITDVNGYAYPAEVTKGDPAHNLTTTTETDYNTGLTESVTNPNGQTSTINTRDAALRPTLVTAPTGATSSASFNDGSLSASSTVNFTDGGTNKTVTSSETVDGWGQIIQRVNAANSQVNTAYDAMGRVVSVTNPFTAGGSPGPISTYQYDVLGRTTAVVLPPGGSGNTVSMVYAGFSITITDQVGRKTQRISDGLGRLVTVNEQDVGTGLLTQGTSYEYDDLNNLVHANQGGQHRYFKYDALSRLLYEKIPEQTDTINEAGGSWTSKYTYTTFGAVATKKDARGVISTYGYDSQNRLTSISYNTSGATGVASTPGVTYNYNNSGTGATKGLLTSVVVGSVYQESYSYDSLQRRSSISRTMDSRTYTTTYQYNTASQRTQITYPSTRVVAMTRDNIGRLSGLTGYLNNVTYNAAGQRTSVGLANGVTETFGYDADKLQLTSQTATKGSTTLMNLTYNHQASAGQMGFNTTSGNTSQMVGASGTINGTSESAAYTYDVLGRLVTSNQASNGASAQRRFAYDRWGNRTGVWDAVTGGNQIQSVVISQSGGAPTNRIQSVTVGSTANYSYDQAGNVTNDGAHSYTYDAENRVVSVDGGTNGQSTYDFRNRRIKKVLSGVTTHYVWQGSRVVAEHNGATGAVLTDYVFSGSKMVAKISGGTTQYFLSDRLSVRMTLDATGNSVGLQSHLPFGEDFAESGTQTKNDFTSYERDAESGLRYAINRGYAASVGRFSQADPYRPSGHVIDPRSWNRFSYTRNDPINRTDRLGLQDGGITVGGPTGGNPMGEISVIAGLKDPKSGGRHDDEEKPEDEENEESGEGARGELLPDDEKQELVWTRAHQANQLLKGEAGKKCRDYLAGSRITADELSAAFEHLSAHNGLRYTDDQNEMRSPTTNAQTVFVGSRGVYLLFGPRWFDRSVGTRTDLFADRPSRAQELAQILVVLHELGHAAGSPNEHDEDEPSTEFNLGIIENCMGSIYPGSLDGR